MIGGAVREYLAAVNVRTGVATAWDPNHNEDELACCPYALAKSVSTVYSGGWFIRAGGQDRALVAALDARTGAATAWDPQLDPGGAEVDAVAVSGSKLYIGGSFASTGSPQLQINFAAFGPAGG